MFKFQNYFLEELSRFAVRIYSINAVGIPSCGSEEWILTLKWFFENILLEIKSVATCKVLELSFFWHRTIYTFLPKQLHGYTEASRNFGKRLEINFLTFQIKEGKLGLSKSPYFLLKTKTVLVLIWFLWFEEVQIVKYSIFHRILTILLYISDN